MHVRTLFGLVGKQLVLASCAWKDGSQYISAPNAVDLHVMMYAHMHEGVQTLPCL